MRRGASRTNVVAWACVVACGVVTQHGCQRLSSTPSSLASVTTPTFNTDIAPVLFEHCASCHRPGEAAPFSVLEYEQVRRRAGRIAEVTTTRAMPPWLPEPGYGNFVGARRLRDEQIELIQRWVEQGAVEGRFSGRPAIPTRPDGWHLGEPDMILTLTEPYTLRPVGSDVFRNFVIPVPMSSMRYVRAIEFRPGNTRVLHHASVGVDRMRVSRLLDRRDPEPGFAAMPEEVQIVHGWTPGNVPFHGSADRSWPLESGSDIVIQLHMLPSGRDEIVNPSIGLFFSDTPPARVPRPIRLESKTIHIPAGQPDYLVEDNYVLPVDVEVVSVYPHAHYLAKDMKGFATLPDGTVRWLIWIAAWDFHWQDHYRYAEPVFLPKGTVLTMRFTYDNSERSPINRHRGPRPVTWGPRSSDEMATLWLEVVPVREEDAGVLVRDYAQRSLRADIEGAEMQVRLRPGDASARNFLATRYLRAGRLQAAATELEEALRLQPDHAEARSNLGSVQLQAGRLPEAIRHLREAARLGPDDDRIRFNLGNAMQASGRVVDAMREYRAAIQLNPDNVDARFNLAMILGARNELDEAVTHLRRVIDLSPQNAEAHRSLGLALALQGDRAAAIEAVREALRLQPDSAAARSDLASLLDARDAAGQ